LEKLHLAVLEERKQQADVCITDKRVFLIGDSWALKYLTPIREFNQLGASFSEQHHQLRTLWTLAPKITMLVEPLLLAEPSYIYSQNLPLLS
jgi:hypothetical protein